MRKFKSREELLDVAQKDSKVFLYNSIRAVDNGATVDDLLHMINSMEDALKATQKELIELHNNRTLSSYRIEAFYNGVIQEQVKRRE